MGERTLCDIFYRSVDTFRKPDHLRVKRGGEWRATSSDEFKAAVEELSMGLRALGVAHENPVTSPTFALVHRYRGAGVTVFHVDAYRIKPGDTVRDLGFDDMLADPRAVVFVEWPAKLGAHAPPFTHWIELAAVDDPGLRAISVREPRPA